MEFDAFSVIAAVIGGLILFLHGVQRLSSSLSDRLSDRAKSTLARLTRRTPSAILAGTIVTIALDSSSAVIILTIVLVNAGALTLRQAMGIAIGANLGTTFGSQLIALNITQFAPFLLLVGAVWRGLRRSRGGSAWGDGLFYAGMLFFGMAVMEQAVEPLRGATGFVEWMERTEEPLRGAGIGALVTLIIQSSSATMGMAIVLVKQGLLGLPGAIAIMLGAELGTCGSALLASIRGTNAAIKLGVFHLAFNATFITIGLLAFGPFVAAVAEFASGSSSAQQLVYAHIGFNVVSVLIAAPFIPVISNAIERVFKE